MKILIADDNPGIRDMFDLLLDSWGYDLDTAEDGQEALEKATAYKYDLIITDLDMPRLNGLETARAIRRECSFVPIMAFTAKHKSIKKDCLSAGMNSFISKPCNIGELQDKITELTVKTVVIEKDQDKVKIGKGQPMDEKHLSELRELRKKGLTKLSIKGSDCEFIVDERIQKKISLDLIGKKQELSEFLDRSEDKPGLCHLYKNNFMVNTNYLLPEELQKQIEIEAEALKNCDKTIVKPLDE